MRNESNCKKMNKEVLGNFFDSDMFDNERNSKSYFRLITERKSVVPWA